MKINPISTNNTCYKGSVIIRNKISPSQNYLFSLHKDNIEKMIKEFPFDLIVEQSKSRKTISLSTNVEGANTYIVKKNKQDFVNAANCAIEDAKGKSELYKKIVKTNDILQNGYNAFLNMVAGKFALARHFEKKYASLSVNDFENFKNIPKINYLNVPIFVQKEVMKNSLKYRIYRMFTTKTPEEKQFSRMRKEYFRQLKAEHKEIKTVDVDFQTGKIVKKNY